MSQPQEPAGLDLLTGLDPAAADLVVRWRRYLVSEKRVSKHTIDSYSRDFGDFIGFLARYRNAVVTPATMARLEVRDFRAFLANKRSTGVSARTTARALSAVRNFYRFIARTEGIENDAIKRCRPPSCHTGCHGR